MPQTTKNLSDLVAENVDDTKVKAAASAASVISDLGGAAVSFAANVNTCTALNFVISEKEDGSLDLFVIR